MTLTKTPVYQFDASHSRFEYANRDLALAIAQPRLIISLISTDISRRYRGAALGAFWVTLTTMATVSGIALMYGKIFGVNLTTYYPYVTTGIIVWGFISTVINDGAGAFVAGSTLFTQAPLPKSLVVFRAIGRAIWVLFFKIIVLVAVLLIVRKSPSLPSVLTSLAGLGLIIWTGFFCSLALGSLNARFRDLGQFVDAILTFSFFATPVFWHTERLGAYARYLYLNPFYHFLNIVRGPIIGAPDVGTSFLWASGIALVTTIIGWFVYGNFARRLPYWC